uniref:Coiled-coil domain containing 198 n=1 Tax=Otolemur garnettii TaxID=30611 RepID=H0XGM6_OTOGA
MGLSYSKARPRVTKVAPLQNKEEETPLVGPMDFTVNQTLQGKSSPLLARPQDQSKTLEGQLPPLRETRYGRYFAASRTMYFDIPLEQGETSIIKRHPPQRLQKLEPMDLPQVITSKRLQSQREAGMVHRAQQELEKKMQTPMYTSGKRQYLHKMKMLEMNRKRQEAQMELKKTLPKEMRINKQNLRDHKAKKILEGIPRNNDHDLLTMLLNETLTRNPGNSQNAEFLEHHTVNDHCPQKVGKMETWLCEQEARGQLSWNGSSSDSDELGTDEKRPRALVRTRTERIPRYDAFFDQE